MVKISTQESTITEMEEQISIIKDTSDTLKREKEELQVKIEQEKDMLKRYDCCRIIYSFKVDYRSTGQCVRISCI